MIELLADNLSRIESHLHQLAWIEPAERLCSLTPAGAGNMNRTLRARLDTRTLILKQAVPFVARYPHIAAPIGRLDVEAAFYRTIADRPSLSPFTPRVYGFDQSNHLLSLQDLGDRGDFADCYPRPERSSGAAASIPVTTLARWLAELHAIPVNGALACRFDNREMRQLNHAHIFEIPLEPDNGLEPLPGIEDLAKAFSADEPLRAGAARLGELYLQSVDPQTIDNGCAPVLLHGDFYPGSWLRGPEADVYLIDPEFAFIGPREFDLGVFLAHLTFLGLDSQVRAAALRTCTGKNGVDDATVDEFLVRGFAGIEIIRRLLGVARLPLQVGAEQLRIWLTQARAWVCT